MKRASLQKRELVDRLMLFLNMLLLIALSATYLAGIISPEKFWPLAFVAMSYPTILVFTALFIVYWLLRRKWFVFLNIAFLLVKWDYVAATIQLNSDQESSQEGIKVMTYNVRLFDYYNWSNNKNTGRLIFELIRQEQPNILCFQEFYYKDENYFPTVDSLVGLHNFQYIHLDKYGQGSRHKRIRGMAMLTSFPIVNKGRISFDGSIGNLCLFTDLLINNDTVRVYNVHFQSIRLEKEGYDILDGIVQKKELKDFEGGLTVVRQMILGFKMRAVQADLVKTHINKCPYPVIVCGDFNDVPTSYAYQTLVAGLEDSFSESGSGIGNTFVKVPFFRIDNILFSNDFQSFQHTVYPHKLSDHFAVSTVLKKKD